MVQGIIGGATSYEEQSLSDVLLNIEDWIKYTVDIKVFMIEQKEDLTKTKFWNKIPSEFQMTIKTSIFYFDTIIYDLNLVKCAIEDKCITEKEVILLRNIGKKAIEFNNEYGKTYREETRYWHDYGNPEFIAAEESYGRGRDYFVTMQDAVNAAYRLEDYMEKGNTVNYTISAGGNIINSQLQQGTTNSTQTMTIENTFDYDKVLETLCKIQKSFSSSDFQEDFGDKAEQVKQIVSESIEMVQMKENPTIIKKALNLLKELAVGVSGSIIASGIVGLIAQLPIW